MSKQRRWDIVHKFEDEYRRRFLEGLTGKESLRLFGYLYEFGQRLVDRNYHKKTNSEHVKTLIAVHRFLMHVK